ncbi:dTDP-glucose 4,6-dehydratase [Rhodobacterales bacterium HKCCD6035]|nr:dTDP-glucose 4,6-dehydratase [Rhodobacterales bacterium HKCCD6035]
MTILVTGAAGFIGSNFVLEWLGGGGEPVVSLDALTYAGNLDSLSTLEGDPRHVFARGDISDAGLVSELLARHRPRVVLNFAAESHVDRSIEGPEVFVQTNVLGTQRLLEAVRAYWSGLLEAQRSDFRFLHVSTDEVYGTLEPGAPAFTEAHRYEPNSPYSASKAASDHLVRAYHHTYGLPVLTTNCSNNYGPRQFPEKLIPLVIRNALALEPLPVYGDGLQVRDWLYVGDHCAAVRAVLERGRPGEVYNVGGLAERTNIEIVRAICDILDEIRPLPAGGGIASRRELVTHVRDRPGHDRRYAVDVAKIGAELGWRPAETLQTGLRRTVEWYLDNANWVERATLGKYRKNLGV